MPQRRSSILFASLLTLFLLAAGATGQQALDFDVLDLAPYGFRAEDGQLRGSFVEMLKAIGDRAGLTTRQHLYSAPRIAQKMKNRQCACSIFLRMPQLDRHFTFVAPIPWQIRIVVVAEQHLPLNTLADLKPLRVAVPRGMDFNSPIDRADAFNRYPTNGYLQSTRMLKRGRVDAMAGTEPSLDYLMRREGLHRQMRKLAVGSHPAALYCIDTLNQHRQLREAVAALTANGELERIIARYNSATTAYSSAPDTGAGRQNGAAYKATGSGGAGLSGAVTRP